MILPVPIMVKAIAVLTRAARLRPGLSGTWRLLGDSCYLIRCPSLRQLMI